MADTIQRGWYWYFFLPPELGNAVHDYMRAHYPAIVVRQTWGDMERSIVLFEVRQGVHEWTLPGRPTRAPKGADTKISELELGPDPPLGLIQLWEQMTGKIWDSVKRAGRAAEETASQTNTALKVLVWGAVLVLLVNLYRSTSAEDDHGSD